jgi:2,4-dienoyl-CoA reductase-like NADH-dependent reductase (Old Yellow Enzyme family)
MGEDFRPVLVLQLTHSGRYSKPEGVPAPRIAHHSPIDSASHVTPETPLLTDAYLDDLIAAFVQAARLAREAGIDAVDIKACHRYLLSELLASFTREHSRYGGSFENRTRLLREVVRAIRRELPDLTVTSRLNIYDALPAPYGWGMASDGSMTPDLTEPLRLIGELRDLGYPGINTTIGNPYYNPYFGRPADLPIKGASVPDEHPLTSFHRFIHLTRAVQEAYPDLNIIGSGYAWIRQFFPQVAAAVLERKWATMIGLGRGAFAYPDFARDILQQGAMDPKKVCATCSMCTQIMRDGGCTGCVVRDAEVYGPIYREGRRQNVTA